MTLPQAQQLDGNGRTIEWNGPSVITSTVLQSAQAANANGVSLNIQGCATVVLLVVPDATYDGVVSFKVSPDGVTFFAIMGTKIDDGTQATSVTCVGATPTAWSFQVSGHMLFEAPTTDVGGVDTVTVTAFASNTPNMIPLATTITSTVLGAGANIIGKAKIVDGSGTNLLAVAATGEAAANLRLIGGSALALGQATAANSIPVTRASDEGVADITVLASGSRTTTQTQADQTTPAGARGLRVVLDMTDITAGPNVTLEIDAKDVASGKYVSLLTGAAVSTDSTNVYVIYPTITAVANSIAQTALPRTWRVKVVANNANAGTYSVGASYLY